MFFSKPPAPAGSPAIFPGVAAAFARHMMPPRRYSHWHLANSRAAITFQADSDIAKRWLTQQRSGLWLILADPIVPFEGGAYAERVLRDAAFCAVRIPNGPGAEDKARTFKPAAQGLVETGAYLYLLWRLASQTGRTAIDAARKAAEMAAAALGGEIAGFKFPLPGTMHDGAMARMLLANPAGLTTLTAFEAKRAADEVTSLGKMQTKDTKWVWPGVLPAGFALMVGAAGLRKTQAAISIGACIATGGYWPASNQRAEPGCVMILASEDDVESVIKCRVLAACSMYVDELVARGALRASERDKTVETAIHRWFATNEVPKLPSGQSQLERWAASMQRQTSLPVKLSIFDPIAHFYESQSTEGVRAGLDPLKDWATASGSVAIGIRHPKKNGGGTETIQDLVSGSMAEMQTVRAAYAFFPALDGQSDEAWMLWAKGNYHAPEQKQGFETIVEDWWTPEGFRTSRVRWLPRRIHLTADEYLDGQTPRLAPPGGGRNGNGGQNGPQRLLGGPAGDSDTNGASTAKRGDAERWVRSFMRPGQSIDPKILRDLAAQQTPPLSRQAIYRLRWNGMFDGDELWTLRG